MSWRMRVVHTTEFEYDHPVTSSFNEARVTPRGDTRQNVILNRVETTPATRGYRYLDYWGTAVTAFDLHAPHRSLSVSSSSVVETDRSWLPAASEASWDDLGTDVVASRYVPKDRKLTTIAKAIAKNANPVEATIAAANWVHSEMEYEAGSTSVHTSAVQAYTDRKGVCQDYAHLTLLLLRSMGIPSRYVSGYLHPKASAEIGKTETGESHAWIEAWTGSWWGFDPTNNTPITEQHVTVGTGRDYADVSPLKGIISGGGTTDLKVTVEVTRLG
jgi:transglutaminase-like putative cysteine protease